jgi:hypothetical protein
MSTRSGRTKLDKENLTHRDGHFSNKFIDDVSHKA